MEHFSLDVQARVPRSGKQNAERQDRRLEGESCNGIVGNVGCRPPGVELWWGLELSKVAPHMPLADFVLQLRRSWQVNRHAKRHIR